MKKYLFILIMPAIWNNLSAQLKTYSGEFEEGRATYTYKESSDGERIYHGKFSFDGGLNRSITGTYINGKKNGEWIYKDYKYNNKFQRTETYNNGILDGKWEWIEYIEEHTGGRLTGGIKRTIIGKEIKNYKQGKLHGVYERDNDGSVISATYNEGKLVGKFDYNDRYKKITGKFDSQGYPTGIWIRKEYNSTNKYFFYKGICYKSIKINDQTGKIEHKEPENAPDDLVLSDSIVQVIRSSAGGSLLIDGNKFRYDIFYENLYYDIDNDEFIDFKNCHRLCSKSMIQAYDRSENRDETQSTEIVEFKDESTEPEVMVVEDEKPYEAVEQMPTFPGGETELMKFIRDNLKYPVIAQENGIQGRVILRFVVSKTGAIDNVTVLRSLDPTCDKEAIRVVKSMPKWIPGKQNGNNVPVYFTLPVVFKLL